MASTASSQQSAAATAPSSVTAPASTLKQRYFLTMERYTAPQINPYVQSLVSSIANGLSSYSLLGDSRFSDVTVIAGTGSHPNSKEYKLHRSVICLNSKFFDAACKENTFIEGKSRIIKLPEIKPTVFDEVVKWLYSGEYKIKAPFDESLFIGLYMASDFLELSLLHRSMQSAVYESLRQDILSQNSNKLIKNAGTVFIYMCRSSHMEDREQMQKISDVLLCDSTVNNAALEVMANSKENYNFFLTLVVKSFQKAFASHDGLGGEGLTGNQV